MTGPDIIALSRRYWTAQLTGNQAAPALAMRLNRALLVLSGWEPDEDETNIGGRTIAGGFDAKDVNDIAA